MAIDLLEYDAPIEPPFYGTSQVIRWESEQLLDDIDQTRLFREGQSGTVSPSSETDSYECDPVLNTLIAEIKSKNLIEPAGLYGYFPVITDDEFIIILDPSDYSTEQAALRFPRIGTKADRSYADYLRPEGDLIAVQMVTLGGARFDESSFFLVSPEIPGISFASARFTVALLWRNCASQLLHSIGNHLAATRVVTIT